MNSLPFVINYPSSHPQLCSPHPAWTPMPSLGQSYLYSLQTLSYLSSASNTHSMMTLSPFSMESLLLLFRLLYPTPYHSPPTPSPAYGYPLLTSSGLWQSISGYPLMWIPSWLDSSSHNLCQDACNMDTFLALFWLWHCTMGQSYCFHDLMKTSFSPF